METITFYSYKGGVGRTLAVANVATYLALLGQKVVALDFDLEAPGLHYKLLPNYSPSQLGQLHGLVDYISAALAASSSEPPKLQEYIIKVPTASRLPGEVWLMPAGGAPSSKYWKKLSQLNWHDFLYKDDAEGAVFFLELKEAIDSLLRPDVLLIDSRTGITEISGVATTLLADKVVCMLLNNRENLEGARVVLGALRRSIRPPKLPPIQIFPVVSRLPAEADFDAERRVVENVRDLLTQQDSDPNVPLDDVLVLHNDPALNEAERILVGGDLTPDKSPLLRDYLRLFAKTVNPELIQRNFNPIIERALGHLLESPDDAQRELENLAFSFNLAPAFRELLKVYRLRNVDADTALRVAQRLWHFGDDLDIPVLMDIIRKSFTEIYQWTKKDYNLDFIEDVWRRSKAYDTKVAIDLAESFDNFSQKNRANAILEEAWKHSDKDNALLARYIRQLSRLNRWEEARSLVDRNRNRCIEDSSALLAWAQLEAAGPWELPSEDLLRSGVLRRIEEHDAVLALKLFGKTKQSEEWDKRALQLLEKLIEQQDARDLYEIGQLFRSEGRWQIFLQALRQHVGPSQAERICDAIIEGQPWVMPDRWPAARRR